MLNRALALKRRGAPGLSPDDDMSKRGFWDGFAKKFTRWFRNSQQWGRELDLDDATKQIRELDPKMKEESEKDEPSKEGEQDDFSLSVCLFVFLTFSENACLMTLFFLFQSQLVKKSFFIEYLCKWPEYIKI